MARPIHFPASLKLDGRSAVVVGDGELAIRRARLLERAGARVRRTRPHAFQPADLDGAAVVFVCTGDTQASRRVSDAARARGVWVNVADAPELSDFSMPAVVERGPLVVAISTSGESPALARRVRGELERRFGDEYGAFLRLAGAARRALRRQDTTAGDRARRLRALADSPLVDHLRAGDRPACEQAVATALPGLTLAALEAEADRS